MGDYTLVIAEKSTLAQSIVDGLRPMVNGLYQEDRDSYRIGNFVVTWSQGHCMELAEPQYYDSSMEKWRKESLPWLLAWGDERRVVKKDVRKQHRFKIIQQLLRNAHTVVHAGDPDREGQLLIDEILEEMQWSGPTKRAWLNETDAQGVATTFRALENNADYQSTCNAAKCRALADQLLGVNLTRAASIRLGLKVPLGRVQTPTLALVVRRDHQVEGHAHTPFWTLSAQVSAPRADNALMSFVMQPDAVNARYMQKAAAATDAQTLRGREVELQVTEDPFVEKAPLPHILRTFAKEAEALHKWTLAKAEDALQSIYEAGLVSYPRTECPYLPEAYADGALALAERLIASGIVPGAEHLREFMKPSRRVYDDTKRAGQKKYGLMPTGKRLPATATDEQKKALEIVVRRFLCTLLPGCQGYKKEARFVHADRSFVCKGERTLNESSSWRALEPVNRVSHPLDQPNGAKVRAKVGEVELKEGKTSAPSRYTTIDLAEDMSSIAKFVTDERVRALLKDSSGIGTDATRRSTIDVLIEHGYIREEKSRKGGKTHLISTKLGRYVVANVSKVLTDPGITALWEEELTKIAERQAEPEAFIAGISTFIAKQVAIMDTKTMDPVPEFPAASAAKKEPAKARKKTARTRAA